MKLLLLVAPLLFSLPQIATAQMTHPQASGCCLKEVPAQNGMCIYHAVLPEGKTICPKGFHFADLTNGNEICPLKGAEPVSKPCPMVK